MNIFMKLVHQDRAIFFTFSPTSGHLYPLQVENCDSNSRLVVDDGDNGKIRLERVRRQCLTNQISQINLYNTEIFLCKPWRSKGFFNLKSSSIFSRLIVV